MKINSLRGNIYNNPKLAYEGDGFYTFLEDGKPHDYWCALRNKENVLLAPVFFNVIDNLPESVIQSCPIQINNNGHYVTIDIGRCVIRPIKALKTPPVIFLNPEIAKKIYRVFSRRD